MDTQHGNLHRLSVTMSRVTYFILRAHTGSGVSHGQHRKISWEVLGQNAGEWTERVQISKEEILGSRRSMLGFVYGPAPGLKGRTWGSGSLISASAVPHCGAIQQTCRREEEAVMNDL